MISGLKQYDKELSSSLQCSFRTKRQLLSHWRVRRKALLEEDSSPSYETLVLNFGPPTEMANVLMDGLPPSEFFIYRRQHFCLRAASWFLTIALAFSALYIWMNNTCSLKVEIVETIIIYETEPYTEEIK